MARNYEPPAKSHVDRKAHDPEPKRNWTQPVSHKWVWKQPSKLSFQVRPRPSGSWQLHLQPAKEPVGRPVRCAWFLTQKQMVQVWCLRCWEAVGSKCSFQHSSSGAALFLEFSLPWPIPILLSVQRKSPSAFLATSEFIRMLLTCFGKELVTHKMLDG